MILGLQLSIRVREFAGGIPPATPIRTSLPITWTDNSAIEDGYRIRWDPTAGGTVLTVDLGANLQSYTIGGLLFNTQYDVEVAAFNGLGESLALGPIILYTKPPAAPTLCTATATGATTANVGWTLPGVEPITGYRVYRSPAGAGTWTAAGTVAAGVATLGVTGLIAATAYDFRVVAYNSNAGVSQPDSEQAPSNTATATTTGGAAGIDPDTLSNREATYLTPISGAVNNDDVNWPDTFSSKNLTTGTPGDRPRYITGAVNGYAAIEVDGNEYLQGSSLGADNVPRTIFAVIKTVTGTLTQSILGSVGGAGSGDLQWRVLAAGTLQFLRQGVAEEGTSSSSIPNNTWCRVALRFDASTWKFWINGVAAGNGTWGGSFSGSSPIIQLARNAAGTEAYVGRIVELRFFTAALADADIVGVQEWQASRYAI